MKKHQFARQKGMHTLTAVEKGKQMHSVAVPVLKTEVIGCVMVTKKIVTHLWKIIVKYHMVYT
jgi:hypothetical protein